MDATETKTEAQVAPAQEAGYLGQFVTQPAADPADEKQEPPPAGGSSGGKRPFTARQLAGSLATATGVGVSDVSGYRKQVAAQLEEVFESAAIGEALAELGIHQGPGGLEDMPAWLRLAGAGVFAGYVVVQTRAQYGRPVSVRPGSPVARAWGWLRSRLPFGGGRGGPAAAGPAAGVGDEAL